MSRPVRALLRCLLVLVALACALATPADARTPAANGSPAGAPPKAWIIVDTDSGAVIDASNPHASLPPASTVKLMTAVTALQTLPLSAPLTVSARAAGVPSRKINMQAGELWSVDNTVKSLLLVSANDAAYTLAENASGSLESFAETMNQTGKKLGLRDSRFGDPAGLDNDQGFGFGDMMSAFDLAVVARNALSVPELAQSMTLQKFEFTGPGNIGHVIKNENLMLSMYPGATGMKTGFTDKAGRTLVASATRDGRTMIAVVLGYFDTYKFAQGLLDAGFQSTPNARGTGEKIPAPRVLTAQARADAWDNLPRA
ncbi:MAG TPA: serine hydrolase, partial [Acidimicrobiia bacterium]|nr:serine hydrolase [Acidimicrobiia bacterium]